MAHFFLFFAAFCLKDLKIFVPEAVITGNAATLSCQYELEQVSTDISIVKITKKNFSMSAYKIQRHARTLARSPCSTQPGNADSLTNRIQIDIVRAF